MVKAWSVRGHPVVIYATYRLVCLPLTNVNFYLNCAPF